MRYPHYTGVGERIKARLRELGISKAEFIRRYQYDPRYFYAWATGRTPTGENAERLARDLGCTRSWLLLGEGEPPRGKRRGAAVLVLALSLLGWASAEAQPLPLDSPTRHNTQGHGNSLQNQQVRMRLIGMVRRILWWFEPDWCTIPAY